MPKSPIFVMRVNVERWRAASVDAPAQGVIKKNKKRKEKTKQISDWLVFYPQQPQTGKIYTL